MLYLIRSPDSFPISFDPFKSKSKAMDFLAKWVAQFERQGYYSTANREHIPLSELPSRCKIITGKNITELFNN